MEKYSNWRDRATGIQPFLTPVPPLSEGSPLATLALALRYILAVVRAVPLGLVALLYVVTVPTTAKVPAISTFMSILWTRLALLLLGGIRIDSKYTASTSRGKADLKNHWRPAAGDVVISNWVSYIELLYLAYRFDPVFILPSATRPQHVTTPSLIYLLTRVGQVPELEAGDPFVEVQERAKAEGKVLVLLPEGTTSNGRGLLKFVDVFGDASAEERRKRKWAVWLMCVKYPTPTSLSPTATFSIPSPTSILTYLTTFPPFYLPPTFYFLSPADAPLASAPGLMEACAKGISGLARLKRVEFGWGDKKAFFEAYYGAGIKKTAA